MATWLHIAADNPNAADHYIDRIQQVCELIAANPGMGVERRDVRGDVRSFPFESHVIFYACKGEGIVVLRVWPAAQDPADFDL